MLDMINQNSIELSDSHCNGDLADDFGDGLGDNIINGLSNGICDELGDAFDDDIEIGGCLSDDFPAVRYNYIFEEVAFLFHKMKQFGQKLKNYKRKCLTRREKDLKKISEKLEEELRKLLKKESESIARLGDGQWQKLFDLYLQNVRLRKTYKHKEFEEIRKRMVDDFANFCSEEVFNMFRIIENFKLQMAASVAYFDDIRYNMI